LMQQTEGRGRMAAVSLSAAELTPRLADWPSLSIAAINAPDQTVVSGETSALRDWLAMLPSAIRRRDLNVDYAFHSPLMGPLRDALETALEQIAPRDVSVPLISTVTGDKLPGSALTASHWGANLHRTVRFADAIAAAGPAIFVELGAHPNLGRSIEAVLTAGQTEGFALATLRRGQPEQRSMLTTLARLYVAGHDPDWPMLASGWAPRAEAGVVRLPPYPWQRRRYWLPQSAAVSRPTVERAHPLIAARTDTALGPIVFESPLAANQPAWLGDHRLHDRIVVPAVAYLESALAACRAIDPRQPLALADIEFPQAIVLAPDEQRRLQAIVEDDRLRLFHRAEGSYGPWTLCMSARRAPSPEMGPARRSAAPSADDPGWIDGADFYASFRERGGGLGPAFQVLSRVAASRESAWAEAKLPAAARDSAPYVIHPVLLDAVLQLPNLVPIRAGDDALYVPLAAELLWVTERLATDHVRCELHWSGDGSGETMRLDAAIYTQAGEQVALVRGRDRAEEVGRQVGR